MSTWLTVLAFSLAGAGVGALSVIAADLRKIEKHLEQISRRKD